MLSAQMKIAFPRRSAQRNPRLRRHISIQPHDGFFRLHVHRLIILINCSSHFQEHISSGVVNDHDYGRWRCWTVLKINNQVTTHPWELTKFVYRQDSSRNIRPNSTFRAAFAGWTNSWNKSWSTWPFTDEPIILMYTWTTQILFFNENSA